MNAVLDLTLLLRRERLILADLREGSAGSGQSCAHELALGRRAIADRLAERAPPGDVGVCRLDDGVERRRRLGGEPDDAA